MTSSAGADRAGLVLVVDDERVVLEVVKQALEVHGHTVLTAPDGAGAIDVCVAEYGGFWDATN